MSLVANLGVDALAAMHWNRVEIPMNPDWLVWPSQDQWCIMLLPLLEHSIEFAHKVLAQHRVLAPCCYSFYAFGLPI